MKLGIKFAKLEDPNGDFHGQAAVDACALYDIKTGELLENVKSISASYDVAGAIEVTVIFFPTEQSVSEGPFYK